MHPPRRMLAASAALAASLCLVGCSVDATIVVTPDDMVSVDVTTWEDYGVDLPPREQAFAEGWNPCDRLGQFPAFMVTPLSTENGLGCHAVGRSALGALGWSGGGFVHAGDRYLAVTGDDVLVVLSRVGNSAGTPSRVRLTLPGEVVATDPDASVNGSTVTWTAPLERTETGRLFALSSDPASGGSDPIIALAAAGGLAAGVLTAVAAVRVQRRSAVARSGDADDLGDEGVR